jgi:competence ComEA-like helix-hairpin-helix protein
MRDSVVPNRQLASFLLIAVASLAGACVKMPRRTSLVSDQARIQALRQETSGAALLVNINTASTEELAKLPGIGKGLAARIVAYRGQQGRFRRAEHLLMVRGISDRRFRAMRALITLEQP